MKIEIIRNAEIIMSNPDSKHNYFGWPSLVRMSDGRLIAGASGFRLDHICPFGKGVIAYSYDDGKTFTRPVSVIDTVLDDRDVGLCRFKENGLIVTSFNNTRKMQRHNAEDQPEDIKAYINAYLDTVTDREEEEALGTTFRISRDGGVTFGKIYKSPVSSPHGPVELSNGEILWVGYVFNTEDRPADFLEHIEAYKLDPENGSTEYIGFIPDIYENGKRITPSEPYVTELSDGTLLCHIRSEENFSTYQSVSFDKGKSWSVPEKLLSDFGGAPCHILKHSSGVICSLYGYREAPFEIRAMFSADNGKSWDTDHTLYVNGVSADLGYPCSAELPDGSIYTVFYAKEKEDSPCNIYGINWRISE